MIMTLAFVIQLAAFCILVYKHQGQSDDIVTLKEERKEMVELLGCVYLDIDRYNGKVMNDTRQKLNDWVGYE